MTLEDQNLDNENETTPKRSGLNKLITLGSTFSAGALTGYLASEYKTIEKVGEVVTDPAFLGCVLLSSPLLLASGGLYYINKELKNRTNYRSRLLSEIGEESSETQVVLNSMTGTCDSLIKK